MSSTHAQLTGERGLFPDEFGILRKYRIGQVLLLKDAETEEACSIVKIKKNLWFGGSQNFYMVGYIRRGDAAKDSGIVEEDDLVNLEEVKELDTKEPDSTPFSFPVDA